MRCCRVVMRATKPRPIRILTLSFSAGSADAHDDRVGFAGSFGDLPILFFDCGARGRIAVQATKDSNWNSPVRSLRTILVEHVEQREFWSGRRFSCHSPVSYAWSLVYTPAALVAATSLICAIGSTRGHPRLNCQGFAKSLRFVCVCHRAQRNNGKSEILRGHRYSLVKFYFNLCHKWIPSRPGRITNETALNAIGQHAPELRRAGKRKRKLAQRKALSAALKRQQL